jgi:hypothetical protein
MLKNALLGVVALLAILAIVVATRPSASGGTVDTERPGARSAERVSSRS